MDNNLNTPDIGEIVSKLTSDPAMMQQISKLAETFKAPATDTAAPIQEKHHGSINDHTHLFNALKPYLNAERTATLNYIIQLFNIINLLEMSGVNLNNLLPAFNTISEE